MEEIVPFDGKLLTLRLKNKKANRNDLICQPEITFTRNQLSYFEKLGTIPKEYLDQINSVLAAPSFKGKNFLKGQRYSDCLVDFGVSEFATLKQACKASNISISDLCSLDHISYKTISRYKKEKLIPKDLLEKMNRRLRMIKQVNDTKNDDTKVEIAIPEDQKIEIKTNIRSLSTVVKDIKNVVRCNGEANLNLHDIPKRYGCDVETFVQSVFSLISSEGYVVFTTYSNGKPIFTLSEPM